MRDIEQDRRRLTEEDRRVLRFILAQRAWIVDALDEYMDECERLRKQAAVCADVQSDWWGGPTDA